MTNPLLIIYAEIGVKNSAKIKNKYSAKRNQLHKLRVLLLLLFFLIVAIVIAIPAVPASGISFGQNVYTPNAVPNNLIISPQPGKPGLQLFWFFPVGSKDNSATGIQPNANETIANSTGMVPAADLPEKLCSLDDDTGKPVPPDCNCIDMVVNCKNGQPFNDDGSPDSFAIGICGSPLAPGDGRYCYAKPVIYLYPEIPTLVNVTVKTNGTIVISDPHYPQGGWKDILAYPDGKLLYKGKQYRELFYESSIENYKKPEKGIVIKTDQLIPELSGILDRLGLIGAEKDEFLSFWVPRLKVLKSPFIFFSLIDKTEKEKTDNVIITPRPDTMIDFIAYFKAIPSPVYDNTFQLPPKPERKGFTVVEWGGSIDY